MTLLIRQDRTYEQVYYEQESQFLGIVKTELSKVLPGFAVLDFSPFIIGDEGSRRRPDLALVHRDYDMWAVVEVELEKHSLDHHVVPQVRTFATGRYNESHATMLHQRDSTLSLEKLCNLTAYSPPVVSVIVNSRLVLEDGWDVLESDFSTRLTFLESFRAEDGDVVVSISGYLPAPRPSSVISLRKDKMMNALVCTRPGDVPAGIVDEMRMNWRERPHTWPVLRTKDTVLFLPPGGFTVRADRNYEVVRIEDGKFELREL